MTDYPIPASAVKVLAKRRYTRAMEEARVEPLWDREPAEARQSACHEAEGDLRAAFDELGMEKRLTGEGHYRLVSRWMPVEKSESCACGESAAWHENRNLREKP